MLYIHDKLFYIRLSTSIFFISIYIFFQYQFSNIYFLFYSIKIFVEKIINFPKIFLSIFIFYNFMEIIWWKVDGK